MVSMKSRSRGRCSPKILSFSALAASLQSSSDPGNSV